MVLHPKNPKIYKAKHDKKEKKYQRRVIIEQKDTGADDSEGKGDKEYNDSDKKSEDDEENNDPEIIVEGGLDEEEDNEEDYSNGEQDRVDIGNGSRDENIKNEEEEQLTMEQNSNKSTEATARPKISLITDKDWADIDRKTTPISEQKKQEEKIRTRDKLIELFGRWENEIQLEDSIKTGHSMDDNVHTQLVDTQTQEELSRHSREFADTQKKLETERKMMEERENARLKEFFVLKNKTVAELRAKNEERLKLLESELRGRLEDEFKDKSSAEVLEKSDERLRSLEGELRSKLNEEYKMKSIAEVKARTDERIKQLEQEMKNRMETEFKAKEVERLKELALIKNKLDNELKVKEEVRIKELADLKNKYTEDAKVKEDELLKMLENEFKGRLKKIQEKLAYDAHKFEDDKIIEMEKLRTQMRLELEDERRKLMATAVSSQADKENIAEEIKIAEAKLREKFEADFKAREERRKEEFKAIKQQLIDEIRAKETEIKDKLNEDALSRVEQLESLLNDVKMEKESEIEKQTKIVNILSALLFKIFEKDRKLFLKVLNESKLTPEDLKRLIGESAKGGGKEETAEDEDEEDEDEETEDED